MDNRYPRETAAQELVGAKMHNPTIEENITNRIKYYQEEIAKLEKIKAQLSTTGFLGVRIHDLREALQF